jgi:hypothetical protein
MIGTSSSMGLSRWMARRFPRAVGVADVFFVQGNALGWCYLERVWQERFTFAVENRHPKIGPEKRKSSWSR